MYVLTIFIIIIIIIPFTSQLITFLGTLLKALSKSTNTKCSFLPLALHFSYICLPMNIVLVEPLPSTKSKQTASHQSLPVW